MKLIPKSTAARCIWAGAILLLMALVGPSLIHLAYRVTTPLSEKKAQTERYHRLANAETFDSSLSDAQRMEIREERMSLFYWFHARGWDIDEDGEDRSWLQPWRELIQHWTNQPRANKTDAGNGSKAICRVSKVLRSPSPDPRRSPNSDAPPVMPKKPSSISKPSIPDSDSDAWNGAEGTFEGSPVLLRYRPKLAEFLGDDRFPRLLTIDWSYETNDSGMPSYEQSERMRVLEDALEASSDFTAHAILTFVRTHGGVRRWHYYIDDARLVGAALNSALQGHPVMPIKLAVEDDPDWDAFSEILNSCHDR